MIDPTLNPNSISAVLGRRRRDDLRLALTEAACGVDGELVLEYEAAGPFATCTVRRRDPEES